PALAHLGDLDRVDVVLRLPRHRYRVWVVDVRAPRVQARPLPVRAPGPHARAGAWTVEVGQLVGQRGDLLRGAQAHHGPGDDAVDGVTAPPEACADLVERPVLRGQALQTPDGAGRVDVALRQCGCSRWAHGKQRLGEHRGRGGLTVTNAFDHHAVDTGDGGDGAIAHLGGAQHVEVREDRRGRHPVVPCAGGDGLPAVGGDGAGAGRAVRAPWHRAVAGVGAAAWGDGDGHGVVFPRNERTGRAA